MSDFGFYYAVPAVLYDKTGPHINQDDYRVVSEESAAVLLLSGDFGGLNEDLDEAIVNRMNYNCSTKALLETAYGENIIIPVIKIDRDDIEEEFQESYSMVHRFSFGEFEEWEIMKELNHKEYNARLKGFEIYMQDLKKYFFDEANQQWFRAEE